MHSESQKGIGDEVPSLASFPTIDYGTLSSTAPSRRSDAATGANEHSKRHSFPETPFTEGVIRPIPFSFYPTKETGVDPSTYDLP